MSNIITIFGDFLQRHAYENVWCTPNQDKQTIFRPARITPDGGTWLDFTVMWRRIKMPDATSKFHVYQIGQVIPMLLGLAKNKNVWISAAEVCKSEKLIADMYTLTGVQLHRSHVWYRVTPENNLIFAVKIPDPTKIPVDLDNEDLHIRLYTNAYFEAQGSQPQQEAINVDGIIATNQQAILSFQQRLAISRAKPYGHTYCFLNGFLVNTIDLVNAQVGDYLEFVYDSSIKRIVTFRIDELEQFTSTLDSAHKYLLHYAAQVETIDYQDDVDLFLVRPLANNRHKGVYYHKNNEAALRMVTHKDYSVPVAYLASYAQQRPELGSNVDDLSIVLHIRHSGYVRPLVFEHNRIVDLYRMNDADVRGAMIGIDSTVSVWNAPALEASGYCGLMRAELGEITRQMVQNAYGYNACSKLLGDTPSHVRTMSSLLLVDVPVGLQDCSTAYEYDENGLLLEWHQHSYGSVYAARNDATRLVEMVFGFAAEGAQTWWGEMTHAIPNGYNYRFYRCGKLNGVIDNNWSDRTESADYIVANNQVTWAINPNAYYPLVRGNRNHITYELDYLVVDGLIRFALREYREDLQAYRTMAVPPGKIEVFLNGKSLIEKLDYFVEFPQITIVNKEYLNDPENLTQKVVVRMTGFCDSDMKHEVVSQIGFVEYGVLSKNNRFDIRDDKVNRIIVDGALYRYDELEYGEEDYEVRVTDARNGAPYAITDIVVPMNNYLFTDDPMVDPTYTLRQRSRLVDEELSDYLTLKLPEKEPVLPSAIPGLYQVVSPFICKIVHDLLNGALWEEAFTGHYDDNYVVQQCQPYEYLLDVDPIKDGQTPSKDYVVIHPHNRNYYLDMGIYQFQFLSRVVKLYGNGKVELSPHIRVELFGD